MTILVTGGAGFIGSHTVKELRQAGHQVAVFDSFEKGARANLAGFIDPQAIFEGNVLQTADLDRVFAAQPFEAVIHFAAYIEAGESVNDPGRFFWNNTAGTINLANAMVKHGVHQLVFSSTAAVYGQPQTTPISETAPTQPTNPYGSSKLLAEEALRVYTAHTPLKVTALRYFNAAGADPDGQLGENHRPETHLIPLVLQVAAGKRAKVDVFGTDYPTPDGTAIRDYIHVFDLAAAHLAALRPARQGWRVYNVGTGRGFSVGEIIATCRQETGRPIPVKNGPRRPGDPPILVADAQKITGDLEWQPRYSDLAGIVKTAWNWVSKSPHG